MVFSELRACYKWLIGVASVVTALSVLLSATVWAADTRYVTVTAQAQSEQRQLKRDIKRLELKEDAGNASAEDKAFKKFLEQDLEHLESIQ